MLVFYELGQGSILALDFGGELLDDSIYSLAYDSFWSPMEETTS